MKTQNVSVSYMRKLNAPKLRQLRALLVLSDRKDPNNGEPCAIMMSWRDWERMCCPKRLKTQARHTLDSTP